MTAPILQVIVGSTRPGRAGMPVAAWFRERAEAEGSFAVDLVDLRELGLPFMDEPRHPKHGDYENEHTRRWSARVGAAAGFVLVTPEYNHGFGGALKNALDFLHAEWAYKPVGFVSYGGTAAGTRAVQMLKLVAVALRMVPVTDSVIVPAVPERIREGRLAPSEGMDRAAKRMLGELARLERALRPLRGDPA